MPSSVSPHVVKPRNAALWLLPLLIGYAVLALLGSVLHRPVLSLIAAALLLCALGAMVLRRPSAGGVTAWLIAAAALAIPALAGREQLALAVVPVLILIGMSTLFARTLRLGREPLITRCVRVIEGEQRLALPGVKSYTRGVTLYWACLLGVQAAVLAILILCANPGGLLAAFGIASPLHIAHSVLAWYPEAGCWAVLGIAFAAEYVFRRWHMRHLPDHPSMRRFMTRLMKCWPQLIQDEVRAS